jgi:hypothetical protein
MSELDHLKMRLGRLEDLETARSIFHDYAAALDEPEPAAVSALFAEDAVLHTPMGSFTGRSEIEKFYREAFAADPSVKRHFIANPKATWIADGFVRLESYFLFVGRDAAASVVGWGTYEDQVDVSGEAPLFAAKAISVHVATDLSRGWALTG